MIVVNSLDNNKFLSSYGNTSFGEIILGFFDGVFPVMVNRRGESGVRFAFGEGVINVFEVPASARGDNRDGNRFGNRFGQLEIVAVLGAVAVHAGEQNFARAERLYFLRPFDGVEFRRFPAAVNINYPENIAEIKTKNENLLEKIWSDVYSFEVENDDRDGACPEISKIKTILNIHNDQLDLIKYILMVNTTIVDFDFPKPPTHRISFGATPLCGYAKEDLKYYLQKNRKYKLKRVQGCDNILPMQ